MKTTALSLISSCFFILLLNAQSYDFIHLNGPFGCVAKVVQDELGYLYMPGWHEDMYRSKDSGKNWETIKNVPFSFLGFTNYFQPGADGYLYVEGDYGIMRSKDQGDTWETILQIPFQQYYVFPTGEVIILDGNGQLQWTDDNGQNWKTIQTNHQAGTFWYNKYNQSLYTFDYSTTQSYFMVSSDHGQSWIDLPKDARLRGVTDMSFTVDGNIYVYGFDIVFKSADGGKTWTGVEVNGVGALSYFVSKDGRIYGSTSKGTYFSDDNGSNWTLIPDDGHNYFFRTVANGNKLFAERDYGSTYAVDPVNNSWKLSINGALESTVYDLAFLSEDKMIAQTNDGFFISEDGGDHWNLFWDLKYKDNGILSPVYQKYIHPTEKNNWFLLNGRSLTYFTNAGTQQQEISLKGIPTSSITKCWVNPINESIYFSTVLGMFRSKDYGQSWVKIYNKNVNQLDFTRDGKMIFCQSGITRISNDDGDFFNSYPYPLKNSSKLFVNKSGQIVAFQESKLIYSLNTGTSWDSIDHAFPYYPDFPPRVVSFTDDGIIYIMSNPYKLWVTKDFGKSYEEISTKIGLYIFNEDQKFFYQSPGGRLYYTPDHDGIYKFNQTITAVSESGDQNQQIYFYPNPFSNTTQIHLTKEFYGEFPLQLNLYNTLAKVVFKKELLIDETNLLINALNPGIYYYELIDSKNYRIGKGKLVVN